MVDFDAGVLKKETTTPTMMVAAGAEAWGREGPHRPRWESQLLRGLPRRHG